VVVTLCGLALYAIGRAHGLDLLGHFAFSPRLGESFLEALLIGSCLPAAFAFASHLESIFVANSELARLALGAAVPVPCAEERLPVRPRVLRGRQLTVRRGERLSLDLAELDLDLASPLAIAGPNGSGKTTLAALIAGVRLPTTGALTLDAVPACDVSRDDAAFVPQDPVLVESLSIAENLRLVAGDHDPVEAATLLRALGLEVPLERPVGSLSRGEQRRVATARALLKHPKLLVLDEPDAWLDAKGRQDLLRTISAISQETSVIVVSHRPDVLARFEMVLLLDEHHRLEALGHPDALRRSSPSFRALFAAEPGKAR